MSNVGAIIEVKNVSKRYQLGQFNAQTLREEIERLFRRSRSKLNSESHDSERVSSEFWALKDVSFSVQRGEVLGIIGRNGAGKSTLLKILSRITEPSTGELYLRGQVASLLEVGTGFHQELTGRENVYLNGAILGMRRQEISAKFDEIVAFAGVEKFIDTPVKRYSSGMYVRLAFAVAAHLEPEILIVDEVLAVGDADFQKKCLGKMQDVNRGGRTILFVSHNLGAIESLCKRTILFEAGRIAFDGCSQDAVAKYLGHDQKKNVVAFESRANLPTITKVSVDGIELLRGNLIIEVEFVSPEILSPPVVGLVLYDSLGNPVFGSNPKIHADDFVPKRQRCGRVRFETYDLPLVGGTYYLSFWLGDWHKNYDHKMHVLLIEWPKKPSLEPTHPSVGPLNWPARWKIKD